MIKQSPIIIRGLEYIRISQLPFSQQHTFYQWISPASIFKLELDQVTIEDCVMYGEYEFWFETQSFNFPSHENLLF